MHRPVVGLILTAVLFAAGCGGATRATAPENGLGRAALGELWEMYQGFVLQNHKPPAQLADLKAFKIPYPRGYSELAEGRYVVRFGTPLEPAGKLLAYSKEAPKQGGLVLLNDGTIKSMPADEVQAALK
jgi:hypothetical protein